MDIISGISTLIAVMAAGISLVALREQRRISKLNANIEFLIYGQNMIVDNPELLELHNITEQLLGETGVTHKELLYILNSLYAGQAYYFVEKSKNIELSKYRQNFLRNSKVKMAWQNIIRTRMIFDSEYTQVIDKFYSQK